MTQNIFSADMFRSGSTHIQMGLCNLLQWRPVNLAGMHGEGQGEQSINPVALMVLEPYGRQVFGGHHPAYAETLSYLRLYKMKPIITIRNLYDTIISIEERVSALWPSRTIPGLYIPPDFISWPVEQRQVWVAENATPWQVKFFLSWDEAGIEKLFVKYEDFYANQQSGWLRILDFYGLEYPSQERLDFCAAQKNNNFNRGVSGRGRDLPRHVKRIIDNHVASWGKDGERKVKQELYA